MATIAAGVFTSSHPDESRTGEIVPLKVPDEIPGRIQTLKVVREEPEGVPLESAPIVVAGGAGAGDRKGWGMISDLAKALNAAQSHGERVRIARLNIQIMPTTQPVTIAIACAWVTR